MKVKDLMGPIQSVSAYFKDVVIKKLAIRIINTDTAQQPSTLAILMRDPAKDAEHFNRALVDCQTDSMNVDYTRWSLEDINHVEAIRRRSKNTIGQSELSNNTAQERVNAIAAFFAAGSVELTGAELDTLTQYYADSPDKDVKNAFQAIMERGKVLVKI